MALLCGRAGRREFVAPVVSGSGTCKAGFAARSHRVLFPSCRRPRMLGIMASMYQKKRYVASSLQGHQHPCRGAEASSHGPACLRTIKIPKLLVDMVIDVPVVQSPQVVHIPVVAQRRIPMIKLFSKS